MSYKALDANDPFKAKRDQFVIPADLIYLDGNSLGLAPKSSLEAVRKTTEQEWAKGLIRSWNAAGWWVSPMRVGDKIGKIIGAAEGQVVACDTTSINIYKALHAALALNPKRKVILAEESSFPTDLYIAEGITKLHKDVSLKLIPRNSEISQHLSEEVAVLLVNQVDYKSGEKVDVQEITKAAHAKGILVIWDLCHSAGAMEVGLDEAKADFAVGCGYKYLNGGPGCPSFIYVAKRHHEALINPISGWWGHAAPFNFETDYRPEMGVRRLLCGSQPILSMSALEAAIDVFLDVDLKALRAKSISLTSYFIALVEKECVGLTLASPREDAKRGSQVSFSHENGLAIMTNLIDRGAIGDFRAPNLIRFGFAPLYVSHKDVYDTVMLLKDILATKSYKLPKYNQKQTVT